MLSTKSIINHRSTYKSAIAKATYNCFYDCIITTHSLAGIVSIDVAIGMMGAVLNCISLKVSEVVDLMKLTAVMPTHIFIFTAVVAFSVAIFLVSNLLFRSAS